MKKQKLITKLDELKTKIVFPSDNGEFSRFSADLRNVVVENLTALNGSERYEATKSWSFNHDGPAQTFGFEISISLAVEVEARVAEKRTVHGVIQARFNCSPMAYPLDYVIEDLDQRIAAFKKGLHEMRNLQLKHILQTQGPDAHRAALERGL